MKLRTSLVLIVALAACATAGLAAERQKGNKPARAEKPARAVRLNLFPGQVYAVEPGIEAALLLTDEQKQKIQAAMGETINAPALQELRKKAYGKDTPEADRQAARNGLKEQTDKARAELQTRLEAILTADQKAFIKKVSDTIAAAEKELRQQYAEKMKAEEATRLGAALTQEQKDAIAKAKPQ